MLSIEIEITDSMKRHNQDDENGMIITYGTVDAQNSYGGIVRDEFSVIMKAYTDEKIKTMNIEEYISCDISLLFPLSD